MAHPPHILLDRLHQGRELVNPRMEVGLHFLLAETLGCLADPERRYWQRWCESTKNLERQADMILEAEEGLRRVERSVSRTSWVTLPRCSESFASSRKSRTPTRR